MPKHQDPLATPVAPHAAVAILPLPTRVNGLLVQLQTQLAAKLGLELERVLETVEQDLFRLADGARNTALQSGHFDDLRGLREQRDSFVPRFLARLETALWNLRAAGAITALDPHEPVQRSGQLRLLEHDEIAEDAMLATMARRQESRAGLPLLLLGQRFGVLAGMPAFEAARLPVGPQSLGRMFSETCAELSLNLDTRLSLYQRFDRQLMAGYPALAEMMNSLLDKANVLPGLAFVPLRKRRGAAPDPRLETDDQGKRIGSADAIAAATATTDDRRAHTKFGVASDEDIQALARQELDLLLARRREMRQAPAGTGADASTPTRIALDTAEVDAALHQLQVQPATAGNRRSTDQIRQALLVQSRQQRGHATSLSPQDNETFELLGLLYAQIGRELRRDTPSAGLLERLQVPLLRVALQDRGFFIRGDHPARQLLNAVAQAGAGWIAEDEIDPQLDQQLGQAVEHVVEHYSGDDTVFESANQVLDEHQQAVARKAESAERRHVEAARGRDKLDLAKQHAADTVKAAIGDAAVPRFQRNVLDQAWVDVLSLTLLRHGQDSDQWQELVEATDAIVAASTGNQPAGDELQPRIEQALGLVGYQGQEASAIASRLVGAAEEEHDPASRTELAIKLRTRTRLGADNAVPPAPQKERNPREQACYNHLRSLPFGTWIEFATNQQGDKIRRRLAWYSPVTGRSLFVNQRGQRVEDAGQHDSLDQVARLLAVGQAAVLGSERESVVDRAWQATLGVLRSLVGQDPPQETSP
ncbi:DUF1631 family protein [Lysobacter sp. A289]